uniref:Uncharacterized protein n=1 Tax=Alexandrium andersonii TaxID=327968 RepID=A0A7S2MFG0_9DINO
MVSPSSLRAACLLLGTWRLAAAQDTTSLLQVDASLGRESSQGSCTCLGWKSVYQGGLAKVGDAREYLPHGEYEPYTSLGENYCLKFDFASHTIEDYTWCYVSAECGSLNGGSKVNDKVSWKTCQAGQDTLYGQLPPGEMVALLKKTGWIKDPTLIPVSAYAYATFEWDSVSAFYGTGPSMSPAQEETMVRIRDSGMPTMICDSLGGYGNGHPDACGPPYSLKMVYKNQLWSWPHFGEPSCIKGCDK